MAAFGEGGGGCSLHSEIAKEKKSNIVFKIMGSKFEYCHEKRKQKGWYLKNKNITIRLCMSILHNDMTCDSAEITNNFIDTQPEFRESASRVLALLLCSSIFKDSKLKKNSA